MRGGRESDHPTSSKGVEKMSSHHRNRNVFGFTLIEFLVCISILGAFIALLLPAVNSARASARKADCAARLRELALATSQFESANRRIPPNLTSVYRQWQFHLLPHLEQRIIYSSTAPNGMDAAVIQQEWAKIPSFLCPDDPDSDLVMRQFVTGRLVGKSDFVGIAGTTESLADGVFPPYGKGVGGAQSRGLRLRDIVDGLSNTLIYGERPPSVDGSVGSWLRGLTYLNGTVGVQERGPFGFGQAVNPMNACGPQKFQPGEASSPCSSGHSWSYHATGAHFVTVSGAVAFFPYAVDSQVLDALATRQGGEIGSVE